MRWGEIGGNFVPQNKKQFIKFYLNKILSMVKNYLLKTTGLLLITLFVTIACTNDETNDFIENYSAIQEIKETNVRTRSISYQTWEEVDSRLAEINAKYNTNWCAPKTLSPDCFTEEFFINLENHIRKELGLPTIQATTLIDDSTINEVAVASTGEQEGEQIVLEEKDFTGDGCITVDLTRQNILSTGTPFLNYKFNISYVFFNGKSGEWLKESSDFPEKEIETFVDETRYEKSNTIYSEDNNFTDSMIEEYVNDYKVKYKENSLKLCGNIEGRNNLGEDSNPTVDDFNFSYTFDIIIGTSTIQVYAIHPSNSFNIYVTTPW